jgi:hypothetical protein
MENEFDKVTLCLPPESDSWGHYYLLRIQKKEEHKMPVEEASCESY